MRPENEAEDTGAATDAGAETAPPAEGAEEPTTPAVATESAPEPDKKQWYIVKVQSGREDSIREAIERRVKIEGLEEYVGQIIVPVERYITIINGKRVNRSRKMYPGYLIANVEYNDRVLYLFRETSGVGDFVGGGPNRAPAPMPPKEVERILITQGGKPGEAGPVVAEKIKIPYEKGSRVRLRGGAFVGMEGEVKEIIESKDSKEAPKLRVEVTIFGRPVPVEVEAWQVEEA